MDKLEKVSTKIIREDTKKGYWICIDIIKSFACLGVVIYHILNGLKRDGIELLLVWDGINDFLPLIHVPLFFFCSGFLFYRNKFIFTLQAYVKLIKIKAVSLLIPYFIFSIAYVILSSGLSNDMATAYGLSSILTLWKEPVAQYWYLRVLFLLFLIVPLLIFLIKDIRLIFVLVLLLRLFDIQIEDRLVNAMAYFLMGMCFSQYKIYEGKKKRSYLFVSVLVGTIIYMGYLFMMETDFAGVVNKGNLISVIMVFLIAIAVKGIDYQNVLSKVLVKLTPYTLYIFLLHTWITGPIRIILRKLGVFDVNIHFVVAFVLGIVGSIIATHIIRRIKLFDFCCSPQKYLKLK